MSNVESIEDGNIFEPEAEIAYDLMNKSDRDQLQILATDILIALRDHPWQKSVIEVVSSAIEHSFDIDSEFGDQTLDTSIEDSPANPVSRIGGTRSAAKFQKWADSGNMRENVEGELRYQYSDDCYIDVDYGRSYRVILGNGEYEFANKTQAEVWLWNNFSRHHYEAGEVS